MARESVLGNQIFQRIEEMIAAEDGLTQQEAFSRLGTEMGKKPATIGANYYRVARNRKQDERKQRSAQRASRQVSDGTPSRRQVDRAGQIDQSLDEMAKLMHAQIEALVEQAKIGLAEHERVEKVRQALSAA